IDAQHEGEIGRIQVETTNVSRLLHELRIAAQLKSLSPVRLQAKRVPNPANGFATDARRLRQGSRAPMRRIVRLAMQRAIHDFGHLRSEERRVGKEGKVG